LTQRIPTIWHASNIEDRAASAAEAAEIARALDDPLLSYYSEAYCGSAALEQGDPARADRHLARQHQLAVTLRQPILQWYDLVMQAKRELVAGSLDDAEQLALKGFEAGQEAGQPDAFQLFAAQLFVIRLHQGRLEELADAIVGAPRRAGASRTVPMLVHAFMATIYCELGREADARPPYERLIANDLDDVPSDFSWLTVIALAGAACARLGDHARAERLLSMLEPHRRRYVDLGSAWLGSTERYLGLLHACIGRYEEAERSFEAAIAAHRSVGATHWLALAERDYARMLRERGLEGDAVQRVP
jgi:tetratricopeptide (TPR) repeat protein